ncbi:MAG TPA: MFS transporter [Dehalococcoidia bacterium]|nr:MFS transporter [Dehalococcoidia bacterium]
MVGFFSYFSMELSLIFMPLFADEMGASEFEVGLIIAAYGIAVFISAFLFGRLSDLHGRLVFIRLGLALAAGAYLLQLVAHGPMILLVVRAFIGFAFGISLGAAMAYVFESGSRVGRYAGFSAGGALVGALVADDIGGYDALFIASAIGAGLALLASLTLREEPRERIPVPALPVDIIWANRRVYLPFLLRHLGACAIWSIFPLFLYGIGADKGWIGNLWAINVGGQFVAMQLVQRFHPARMFAVGLVLSLAVFIGYGVSTHYLQLIPVQIVLAIAFSCLWVGALTLLMRRNVERGTAVGLLYTTEHLAGGVGPLMGGAVAQAWGFSAVMFCAAGLTFGGMLVSWAGAMAGKSKE